MYGDGAIAFLFPGQGAQYQGMGLDFLETKSGRELFALASEIMGRNMASLIREADGETLKRSDISQPAITLVNLAAAACLGERGLKPAACAGHSLGEYAALVSTGVLAPEDCFRLVKARGLAMQAAADRGAGEGAEAGMAAILGLSPEQAEALIAEWTAGGLSGLYAANYNSPRQVVVSGTAAALEEAQKRFKEAGARRVVRLQVAGPFHSPLIAGAAERLAPILEETVFHDPAIPFYSNVTGGRVFSGAEARKLALRQITEPVRWTTEEEAVAALGIDGALETGPGKTLQGLWKETGSAIPCYAAGTVQDIEIRSQKGVLA